MFVKHRQDGDIFVVISPLLYFEKACGLAYFNVKKLKNGKKIMVYETWRWLLYMMTLQVLTLFYGSSTLRQRLQYQECLILFTLFAAS